MSILVLARDNVGSPARPAAIVQPRCHAGVEVRFFTDERRGSVRPGHGGRPDQKLAWLWSSAPPTILTECTLPLRRSGRLGQPHFRHQANLIRCPRVMDLGLSSYCRTVIRSINDSTVTEYRSPARPQPHPRPWTRTGETTHPARSSAVTPSEVRNARSGRPLSRGRRCWCQSGRSPPARRPCRPAGW